MIHFHKDQLKKEWSVGIFNMFHNTAREEVIDIYIDIYTFKEAIKLTYKSNFLTTRVRKTWKVHWCAIKNKIQGLWTSFKTIKNNYRDALRKAKQKSWTNFRTDIEKGIKATRLDKLFSWNT